MRLVHTRLGHAYLGLRRRVIRLSLRKNAGEPVSRAFGVDRGTAIDRHWIEAFLAMHASPAAGAILEAGGTTYSQRYYPNMAAHEMEIAVQTKPNGVVCDLEVGNRALERRFDVMVATQLFNFIFDVRAALANSAAMLRPGGLLVGSVAGITQVSRFDAEAVRAHERAVYDRAVEGLWPRLEPGDLVRALLTNAGALAEHLPGLTARERSLLLRGPDAPWTDADVPLLDEAASLVGGPPDRTYGHVVVDEAQELTAMQWRMLVRRCPARAMTLVGDFAQAGPAATARDWKEALGPHVGTRFRLHDLTVGYRTTREILESVRDLRARIAPDQKPTRSLRSGESPRTVSTPAAGLAATVVREVRAQSGAYPGELLGVICADTRVAELTARGIAGHARVVPASEARGLEFDGVVVVDPEDIVTARPGGERDLYVALTRATKRLCTITVRPA